MGERRPIFEHIAQKEVDEEECLDLIESVNERNVMYRVKSKFLINMDETPLYNDNSPEKTVADKGM
jgi:hypothetical protein